MSELSKTNFETTFNDPTTGAYRNGQAAGAILPLTHRNLVEHTADSVPFFADLNPVTASGADTYTVSMGTTLTSYANGRYFLVLFTNANTGAATLNVNGLGAKAITKNGVTALSSGDLAAGSIKLLGYDGTRFQVIGATAAAGANLTVGTSTITGGTDQCIPFNDAGVYNEDTTLKWDKTNNALTVNNVRIHSTGATTNAFIGNLAGNLTTTSANNVAIGFEASKALTNGGYNTIVGSGSASLLTTGSGNVSLGNNALASVTTASSNIAIGSAALQLVNGSGSTGYRNTAVGDSAGSNITTGSYNVIIGAGISALAAATDNQLSIQNIIFGTGNSGTGTTVSTGNIGIGTNAPDRRFHVEQSDGVANTVLYAERLTRTTTTTATAGIGVGQEFEIENGSGNNVVGATIEATMGTVTNGTESVDLVFKTMNAGSSANEKLRVTSDGRVYGTALHNNSGPMTGTTNQYIGSGTYTPTLFNTANVSASTAYLCMWTRVGNIVTVSGFVDIDPTLITTLTQLDMSLPIASSFTTAVQLAGTGNGGAVHQGGYFDADATNDRARFFYVSNSVANLGFGFTFQYVVL